MWLIENLINNWLINEYRDGYKSYQDKKSLIIISIDFRKAFDSLERKGFIKALKYYQVHDKVIDNMIELCTLYKWETEIWKNNKMVGETEISNGVRKGCTDWQPTTLQFDYDNIWPYYFPLL